jgi:chromosome condensin MukBEF complex kleisin-like MukF subunit
MNNKEKFLFQLSKSKKYDFDTTTMLESRLSKLIDLADEADNLVENIEEATNAWENKIYEAKEYYNGEIFDEIESVKKTMDELGVSLEGTTFESVARQSEELNEKLSNVLGSDLFVVTREIKNSFS